MNAPDAQSLFDQLSTFSGRLLAQLKLPSQSPWGTARLADGAPKGAILHYTADSNMQRVVRWFCDPKLGAKCSAHAVVGDRKYDWAKGLDSDLPWVQQLPVTVVLCRDRTEVAWHATWTNTTCYGIENVNAGELRQRDGQVVWWRPRDGSSPEWTSPWQSDKTPVAAFGRLWEPFTNAQITANVILLSALHALKPLQPAWVVGHEAVQGTSTVGAGGHDKRDAGPVFPVHAIRQGMLTGNPGLPDLGAWRQDALGRTLAAVGQTGGNAIQAALINLSQGILSASQPHLIAKGLLYQLGYAMDDLALSTLTTSETQSVYLFQKMMGLLADGVLGAQTFEALKSRVPDRMTRPSASTGLHA